MSGAGADISRDLVGADDRACFKLPDRILGSRDGRVEGKRIQLYDFKRPDKFSREQIRTIQQLTETFNRLASSRLSMALRLPCELTLDLVDQMTYAEFMGPLASPAILASVSMEALKGQAVMHIDAAGADAMIERLFGAGLRAGSARPLEAGGISDIEFAQVERVLAALVQDLGEAWGFVPGIKPALTRIETETRFCQVVPAPEMVVLSTSTLNIASVKGSLSLVYPFLILEPVLHLLSAKNFYWPGSDKENPASRGAARGATMPAELIIDAGALSIGTLRTLRKGSVIELPDDGGQAWLRLGGARVAGLLDISSTDGELSAAFSDARIPARKAGVGESDPMAALAGELKAGLASIKESVSGAMATMSRHIDELKGGQEDLSDRVLFSQADTGGQRTPAQPFASLAGVPAEVFALFLSNERPQVCALILSFLDDALAARLLSLLPGAAQPEIMRRVATMDWVTPQVLVETERILAKKLSAIEKSAFEIGGLNKAIRILNFSPRDTERTVIMALDRSDPELAESIKRGMFVFEDIIILDDESIAAVLEEADEKDIVVAMKPMKDDERRRLLERFPADRRERMGVAFAALGRVRLSDCDAASFRVVEVIRRLEEEGRIGILRQGE